MLRRREFLALSAVASAAWAAPRLDLGKVPTRKVGKVETVFKSPGPKPNGLQATKDGLWVMDQGEGNRAYLVSYEDGKTLRGFETEADRASGITFDGEAIWIASTYDRMIVRADAMTGKTIQKYVAPGSGPIYRMVGDPPGRSSPLARANRPEAGAESRPKRQGSGRGSGLPPGGSAGTGAHGLEWRDGKLWMASPPARAIFRVDPKSWTVEESFPTVAHRPHGIGWEGQYLWCTDSNLNAFFKHDTETGEVIEKIQLAENDPLPHGMSIWQGYLWYCDDVGVVCRLKM
jgi:streptogramin lyase